MNSAPSGIDSFPISVIVAGLVLVSDSPMLTRQIMSALAAVSSTSTAAAIFTGVGLVTLGILALAGIAGEVLIVVALLGLGAYVLLEDATMVEHLTSLFGQ
jgi:hypothetical protein